MVYRVLSEQGGGGPDNGLTDGVGKLLPRHTLRQASGDNLLGYLVSGHATIMGRSLDRRLRRNGSRRWPKPAIDDRAARLSPAAVPNAAPDRRHVWPLWWRRGTLSVSGSVGTRTSTFLTVRRTCSCPHVSTQPGPGSLTEASDITGWRNKYRDVAVQVRQAAIESRQLPFAASCELSKVGICYLSVTDHTANPYISERDTVGPELVAVRTLDCTDDIARSCRGLPRPQQESNKTSLCDRARRKSSVGCR